MLAVLFGLSMDYQVFLVSRMHEEWVHTHDNRHSVIVGQATTGRVITAAAAIMICVFAGVRLRRPAGHRRVRHRAGRGGVPGRLRSAHGARAVHDAPLRQSQLVAAGWADRRMPHLSVEPAEEAEEA